MRLPQPSRPALRSGPAPRELAPHVQPASAATVNFRNNADTTAVATLRWGDIDVGNCGAAPNGSCGIGSELVWYDVYAKRADTNELLASKRGVYGNSAVVLVKDGAGYRLV